MRTIIDVPDAVIESLDRVRARDNRSRAAVIREAIDGYLQRQSAASAEGAFGLWRERSKDGVRYQDEVRNDWASQ
ncbi:MAG: ribbon-helix-helix protein, CopG family [Puniceicoccaceae bacterium]|nr:MAG: ribbon-helix-helix protein, CopG family [Puniceicoccaceae bacterium]